MSACGMQVLRWGMMQPLAMAMQLLRSLTLHMTLQHRCLLRLHQVRFLHSLPTLGSTAHSAGPCSIQLERLSGDNCRAVSDNGR